MSETKTWHDPDRFNPENEAAIVSSHPYSSLQQFAAAVWSSQNRLACTTDRPIGFAGQEMESGSGELFLAADVGVGATVGVAGHLKPPEVEKAKTLLSGMAEHGVITFGHGIYDMFGGPDCQKVDLSEINKWD